MINIVSFNGGRGASSLIPSLLTNKNFKVTSIVNAYDDGKSTGAIRAYFDMLGPSDIRKVQQLMLPKDNVDYNNNYWLFDFRLPLDKSNAALFKELSVEVSSRKSQMFGKKFKNKALVIALKDYLNIFLNNLLLIKKAKNFNSFVFQDCSLMNCIYAGAFIKHERNIEAASLAIEKLFNLSGSVLPNSLENKKLMGIRENGKFLYNEAEIVELRSNVSVERIFLLDEYLDRRYFSKLSKAEKLKFLLDHESYVQSVPRILRAINDADIIVYSPGTQHSSLYPTYLTKGIARAISDNKDAKKIFITNIGADYETPKYFADDYILGAYKYLQLSDARPFKLDELFTHMLVSHPKTKNKKNYVQVRKKNLDRLKINTIIDNFESDQSPGKHCGDKLLNRISKIYQT